LNQKENQLERKPPDVINLAISGAIFVVAFITYFITKAPTVSFWDCGEFIACSYILGIPHPPGTPLFVLIGRIFTLLPLFREIALRVNFISVLTSALTVWLSYLLIVKVIRGWFNEKADRLNRFIGYAGGAVGALILTFSDTFWFNAVEAEVYGLAMLLMVLICYLGLLWAEDRHQEKSGRYLVLITYLAFLSLGVHMTVFLILPVLFLFIVMTDREKLNDWRLWLTGVCFFLVTFALEPFLIALAGLFLLFGAILFSVERNKAVWGFVLALVVMAVVGYSTQLYIPLRSACNPAIDENDPENWDRFKYFLERKQYGQTSMIEKMFHRRGTWGNQFGTHGRMGFWGFFSEQYGSPNLSSLGFLPFILGALGAWESLRRKYKVGVFLVLIFLICSLGLVLYMNFSDGTRGEQLEVRDRDYFFTPGFMFFAILIGLGSAGLLSWVRELSARTYSRPFTTATVGALALLLLFFPFANTLGYHFESHDRRGNYIPYDYAHNILNSCDEDAVLFTNGDNDTFPVWFLQEVEGVRTDVRVANLSLLNTHWYIKQLKYKMGVPIRLTDQQIEHLTAFMTPEREVVRVQDQMIREIIISNNWKYPIYFAVTVSPENKMGLTDNFKMEGMAYRVVPEKGKNMVDPEKLRHRLSEVFRFRGLNDPEIYKSESDKRLVANYVSTFLQLAEYYRNEGRLEEAIAQATEATKMHRDSYRPYLYLAQLYSETGQLDKVERLVETSRPELGERLYVNSAYALATTGDTAKAIEFFKKALKRYPNSNSAMQLLSNVYYRGQRYEELLELLDDWINAHPEDGDAIARREGVRAIVESSEVKLGGLGG
jgi:tetratricopeptide (TPR) repeat protein